MYGLGCFGLGDELGVEVEEEGSAEAEKIHILAEIHFQGQHRKTAIRSTQQGKTQLTILGYALD